MSYLGSKAASGVYQKIIAEMPPHDTYIETHLGGGAIMLRKPPAKVNWGIDNRARYDSHLRSVSNGRGREVKARCGQIIN